ncbi:MAG: hypothetical protein NTV34_12370, partial [Proteobacteria bacterium]|nr:hypothetical protein [Pseudomonadota bacterium]
MKSNVVYMLIICSIFALSCKARTEYSQAKDVKSSLKKFNIEYDITEFRALSAENLPAVINLKLGGGIGRAIYANDVKDWEAAFDIREFES